MITRHLLLLSVTFLFIGYASAQFIEKHNQAFHNVIYDVFSVQIDSSFRHQFTILENKSLLPEKFLFDSISNSSPIPFFAITASVVDSVCQPLGLFVFKKKQINPLNQSNGNGNFYLKPNGYLVVDTNGRVWVRDADGNIDLASIKYAIQSGPMLVKNGIINSSFNKDSKNLHIRCAVSIIEEKGIKKLLFVRSIVPVNFYQFAKFFLEKYKCKDVLNLESGANCSIHLPTVKTAYSDNKKVCRYFFIQL